MSVRLSAPRAAALTAATAVALLAGSGIAAADPPALNRDDCAATVAEAGSWPGSMSDGSGSVRLVSDAFDGYLSRSEACRPDLSTR